MSVEIAKYVSVYYRDGALFIHDGSTALEIPTHHVLDFIKAVCSGHDMGGDEVDTRGRFLTLEARDERT